MASESPRRSAKRERRSREAQDELHDAVHAICAGSVLLEAGHVPASRAELVRARHVLDLAIAAVERIPVALPPRGLVGVAHVAAVAGISTRGVRQAIARGQLRAERGVNGDWLCSTGDVWAWLNGRGRAAG